MGLGIGVGYGLKIVVNNEEIEKLALLLSKDQLSDKVLSIKTYRELLL